MAMKTVTASEANRQFSAVLRDVAQGERVTVTSRGKPVATIEPVRRQGKAAGAAAAKRRLFDRLAAVGAVGSRRWARDDLYD
jgi:prevent-host-death family protein